MRLTWQSSLEISAGDSLGARRGPDPPPHLWASYGFAGQWKIQIRKNRSWLGLGLEIDPHSQVNSMVATPAVEFKLGLC